jgi:hypothetical protein
MNKNVAFGLCSAAIGLAVIGLFGFAAPPSAPAGFSGTPLFLPVVGRFDPPTATPTDIPTETPLPTDTQPAPPPPGVNVVTGPVAFVDIVGYLHVLGEVDNNSGGNIEFVKITANLFNGSHQLVDTGFTYSDPLVMPNGQKTCFDVLINNPPAYSSIEFEAPTYDPTSSQPSPGLIIVSPSSSVDGSGYYHIIGQVTNSGAAASKYVQLVGTLYDGGGVVVDCDFTYVNSTDLAPGQTSSFDITYIYRPPYANVDHWSLIVNGEP